MWLLCQSRKKKVTLVFAEIMFAENGKTEDHHIKQNKVDWERGVLFLMYMKSGRLRKRVLFLMSMKSILKSVRF